MTSDNLLEVGDLILYQDKCNIDLAVVDKVYRRTVSIEFPDGIHLRVDRKTDGNMPYGRGKPNPFAIMIFILWEVRKNPVRTRNNEISISRLPHMNLFQNERNITKAS